MDGSGDLLESQTHIWEHFDVRCLYLPSEELDWEQITQATVSLIKEELAINGKRKIYLCGESFGGCLALKLIELEPKLFDQVVIINCASAFSQRPLLTLGIFFTEIMSNFAYRYSAILLLPFLGKLGAISKKEKNKLLKVMRNVPPKVVSSRLALLRNFEFEPPQVYPRLLFVAGKQDNLLPSVSEAQRLKQEYFPSAKVAILPNSGHCCLLETDIDLLEIMSEQQLLLFQE